MTVSENRFGSTRDRLSNALNEYHQLREEVEKADFDDNVFIVLSGAPSVLKNLAYAAFAHARTMQDLTDDIYWQDLSGEEQ